MPWATGEVVALSSVEALAICLAVAVVAVLVSDRSPAWLPVPPVVIQLVGGVLVGPAVLGWAHEDEVVAAFSDLGLAMRMFLAGYEIEMARVRGRPLRTARLGSVGMMPVPTTSSRVGAEIGPCAAVRWHGRAVDAAKTIPAPSPVMGPSPGTALRRRRPVVVAAAGCLLVALSGCSAEPAQTPVEAAQAGVTAAEEDLAGARSDLSDAEAAFCSASATYITALDRYGDVLNQTAVTVGDVADAGQDLTRPREETATAADDAVAAREAVAQAEQDLAEAQADLAAAEASAGATPAQPEASAASETTPAAAASPNPTTIARVEQAETEFADARAGITDQTPLVQAAEQFNAAAVALEMAWLQLFAESGCLTEEQQAQAVTAVRDYTVALQQALTDTGYYSGQVDGVYGPMTVDAVQALQAANGLPQTGTVDKATDEALQAELEALEQAAAQQTTATTAALQQTLALAGYWDGPIDGVWTDALTQALMTFQTDLGVPATGAVDAATIAAFQEALARAQETPTSGPTAETSPEESAQPSPTES